MNRRARDRHLRAPWSTHFRDDLIFVGGHWQKGRGAPITSLFAAEGCVNTTLSGAAAEDVELAIARARDAQPGWGGRSKPHERATVLYRISEGIAANIDRIAWVQSRDTSKTLTETRALATSAAGTFRYFAAVAETSDDLLTVPRGGLYHGFDPRAAGAGGGDHAVEFAHRVRRPRRSRRPLPRATPSC